MKASCAPKLETAQYLLGVALVIFEIERGAQAIRSDDRRDLTAPSHQRLQSQESLPVEVSSPSAGVTVAEKKDEPALAMRSAQSSAAF
jgi:hypothetical protein